MLNALETLSAAPTRRLDDRHHRMERRQPVTAGCGARVATAAAVGLALAGPPVIASPPSDHSAQTVHIVGPAEGRLATHAIVPLTTGRDINRNGVYIFTDQSGNLPRHFINDGLTQVELLVPPHLRSPSEFTKRISDTGWVLARVPLVPSGTGYWRPDGSFAEVPMSDPNITWIDIRDINSAGVMCGSWIDDQTDRSIALIYSEADGFIALPNIYPDPTGTRGSATTITNDGIVLGQCEIEGDYRSTVATKWTDGVVTALPLDRWIEGEPRDMSPDGRIVGIATGEPDEGYTRLPVIWEPGAVGELLPHPNVPHPDWDVWTRRILDDGRIVGGESDYVGDSFNYIYWPSSTEMPRPLFELLPPRLLWSPWDSFFGGRLPRIEDISGTGFMVGYAWREAEASYVWFAIAPVTPTFMLSELDPGRAGVVNRITISGAPANARVRLFAGRHGGGKLISGCSLRDNVLQIEDARLLATIVADATGMATYEGVLPPDLAGVTVLFQASTGESCAISNLVVQQFE